MFSYSLNYLIDMENAVIPDVEAIRARVDETALDVDTVRNRRGATVLRWSVFQSLFMLTFGPIGRSHPREVHFNNDSPRYSNDRQKRTKDPNSAYKEQRLVA